jgi:SAM-dependent methyltransferase
MDRREWVAARRVALEADYDGFASWYDTAGYPTEEQHAWVARVLARLAPGSTVLDAPCGTGRYFAMIAAAGCAIVGIDQSAGMLTVAAAHGLARELHHVGLQEMGFATRFDAILTIDAMENVSPEDWPVVLDNGRQALKPGAPWYLTVEENSPDAIDAALARLVAEGHPAVRGEAIEGRDAVYHYYPDREQVLAWIEDAGLDVIDEGHDAHDAHDGWGYRHFLLVARS